MKNSCARGAERFRISSFGFSSAFVIRMSSFNLTFHIADRRESHDRFADSCQLRRGNYLLNILVSSAGCFRETRPRRATDVNAARFQIALELFAVPLLARLGAAHRSAT